MRKTKWDVPAKCPIDELPCGFHLEVGTPGDLSTMARIQNKPFDARAVRVNVAYGAHPPAFAVPSMQPCLPDNAFCCVHCEVRILLYLLYSQV